MAEFQDENREPAADRATAARKAKTVALRRVRRLKLRKIMVIQKTQSPEVVAHP
jgi:hypothetical protein